MLQQPAFDANYQNHTLILGSLVFFEVFVRRFFLTPAKRVSVRHRPDLATARHIGQRAFTEQRVSICRTIPLIESARDPTLTEICVKEDAAEETLEASRLAVAGSSMV